MFPIRPEITPGIDLALTVGKKYICPYCQAQSIGDMEGDIGWVVCPMRPISTKWICLGCLEDIYSACLSTDYLHHPYRDIVQGAARLDGMDEHAYRLACIQHQLQTLISSDRPPNQHIPSREYLELLIAELQS
ncbi:MAG: hypothetical protein LC104_19810 [Bacteroidales bacterium]|nr:hypothetical protein [Bacteroidales bacterium]